MTPDLPKRLRMFAGPNGSGKTSLVRKLGKEFSADGLFQLYRYINADDIFRSLRDGQAVRLDLGARALSTEQVRAALITTGRLPADHRFFNDIQVIDGALTVPAAACDAYAAAAIADFARDELLAAGRPCSFETVMSHPSKIDVFARARAAGYRNYLYFMATESPLLNLHRVENRAALGGHSVPENKIVERYQRCLQLVGDALSHAHRAFLFDNSGPEPLWLAQLSPEGKLELKVPPAALPSWFQTWVVPRYELGR
ncbi:MAG: hypothetical protein K2R98_31450 [Gemmataceae bacterium]|nr:hypothetical protein [Gemmataceae bacterium]